MDIQIKSLRIKCLSKFLYLYREWGEGKSAKEVSELIDVSPRTANDYRRAIKIMKFMVSQS